MNYANYLALSFQIFSNLFNAAGECRNFASWKKKSLLGDLAKSQWRKSKTCKENKQTSKTTKNTENYELWIDIRPRIQLIKQIIISTTDLTD